jgi:heme-degrading monooxygenase HmoA
MFARRVYLQLKPNSTAELTKRLETEIIPLLRKQKGFQDEIAFVSQNGKEAFGISLWDNAENAEAYTRGAYPEVTKALATVVEGAPRVETFEVVNSTFHRIAATVTA